MKGAFEQSAKEKKNIIYENSKVIRNFADKREEEVCVYVGSAIACALVSDLFNSNRLGQVTREVNINSVHNSKVV